MNEPAKFGGYTLYQQGYQLNEFSKMTFKIYQMNDPETEALGEFTVNLFDPKTEYDLDSGFRVEVVEYYPDYTLMEDEVRSKTNDSNNPAFVFNIYPSESGESEISFVGDVIGSAEDVGIDTSVVDLEPMSNVI